MNQTLTVDALLVPGPPKSGESGKENIEDPLLAAAGKFESGQRSPDRRRRQREGGKDYTHNKRSRHDRHSDSTLEKKLQEFEFSIEKLKAHKASNNVLKNFFHITFIFFI